MAQKYKPGDLVRLKSGGPAMTIEKVNLNIYQEWEGTYSCSWFAGAKDNHRSFAEEALQPAEVE